MHHEFKAATYIPAFHRRNTSALHAAYTHNGIGKRISDRKNVLVSSCHALFFSLCILCGVNQKDNSHCLFIFGSFIINLYRNCSYYL